MDRFASRQASIHAIDSLISELPVPYALDSDAGMPLPLARYREIWDDAFVPEKGDDALCPAQRTDLSHVADEDLELLADPSTFGPPTPLDPSFRQIADAQIKPSSSQLQPQAQSTLISAPSWLRKTEALSAAESPTSVRSRSVLSLFCPFGSTDLFPASSISNAMPLYLSLINSYRRRNAPRRKVEQEAKQTVTIDQQVDMIESTFSALHMHDLEGLRHPHASKSHLRAVACYDFLPDDLFSLSLEKHQLEYATVRFLDDPADSVSPLCIAFDEVLIGSESPSHRA